MRLIDEIGMYVEKEFDIVITTTDKEPKTSHSYNLNLFEVYLFEYTDLQSFLKDLTIKYNSYDWCIQYAELDNKFRIIGISKQ